MKEEKKNKRDWTPVEDMEPKRKGNYKRPEYNPEEEDEEDSLEESEKEEEEEENEEEPEEKKEKPKQREMTAEEKQRLIEQQIIALRDEGVYRFQDLQLKGEMLQVLKGIGNNLIEVGKILDEKLGN